MIALLFGLASVAAALAGGGWWPLLIVAAGLHAVRRRWSTPLAVLVTVASLPFDLQSTLQDGAAALAGALGAVALALRWTARIPWRALPVASVALLAILLSWSQWPPHGFWDSSDVAVRARLSVLAVLALALLVWSYGPRYRNRVEAPSEGGAAGTTGARDEAR